MGVRPRKPCFPRWGGGRALGVFPGTRRETPEDETAAEYAAVYGAMETSIKALIALPVETMDGDSLRARLAEIGQA